MPNQLITDVITTTGKPVDTAFELAVEREILLADYDKPVFKIVKTVADHAITQKYINGNKLIIEGFFRISVFYQPPGGEAITVVNKKQTFRKQLDLPDGISDNYFINISGDVQYINTRAINSSRIAISGIYQFDVRLYCSENMSVVTAINSTSTCADSEEIAFFSLCGRGSRQFSSEDELSMPDQTDKILHISSRNGNMNVTCYQDKVNVKGDIYAEIIYTVSDSPELRQQTKKFAYNQIIDIRGVTETNVAYASLDVISFTITQNGDSKQVNCIVTAQIDIKAFKRQSVISVQDAFSKNYEYDKKLKNILRDKNIVSVNKTAVCTVEDTIGNGYTPVYSLINVSPPEVSFSEGRNVLKSKSAVSVIVMNSRNEYECFTKTGEILLDTGKEVKPDNLYMLSCNITEKNISITGDTLKAVFSVELTGFVLERQEISVLDDYSESNDVLLTKPKDALIMYFAEKGEKIFDIAMKYHTDSAMIMKENKLENKVLAENKMLFVPSFGL